VAKADLGTKRICPTTGKKFYDLNKNPVISPYTGEIVPIAPVPPPRTRADAAARAAAANASSIVPEPAEAEELVSLEEADAEENTGKVKAQVPESEDDIEVDETLDDDDDDDSTFIAEDEEDDDGPPTRSLDDQPPRSREEPAHDAYATMASFRLFASLSRDALVALASAAELVEFVPGAMIIVRDERAFELATSTSADAGASRAGDHCAGAGARERGAWTIAHRSLHRRRGVARASRDGRGRFSLAARSASTRHRGAERGCCADRSAERLRLRARDRPGSVGIAGAAAVSASAA